MTELRVRIREPEREPVELGLRPGLSFGRHKDNDFRCIDTAVSAHHARVVDVGRALAIEDLGSANRTKIQGGKTLSNGERELLKPGVVFVLGRTTFEVIGPPGIEATLVLESSVPAPASPAPKFQAKAEAAVPEPEVIPARGPARPAQPPAAPELLAAKPVVAMPSPAPPTPAERPAAVPPPPKPALEPKPSGVHESPPPQPAAPGPKPAETPAAASKPAPAPKSAAVPISPAETPAQPAPPSPASPAPDKPAPVAKPAEPAPPKPAPRGEKPAHPPASAKPVPLAEARSADQTIPERDEKYGPLAAKLGLEAAEPRLVLKLPTPQSVPIQKERVVVGRSATGDADLVLEDKSVSRQHAALSFESGACYLEDLGSENGTGIGDEVLPSRTRRPLASDTVVRFGSVEALFVLKMADPRRRNAIETWEQALDHLVRREVLRGKDRDVALADSATQDPHPGARLILAGRIDPKVWADAVDDVLLRRRVAPPPSPMRRMMSVGVAILVLALIGLCAWLYLRQTS